MTNKEINKAIAEILGEKVWGWWCPTCAMEVKPKDITFTEIHDERLGGCGSRVEPISAKDYSGDLNAIYQAEETLNEKQLNDMFDILCDKYSDGTKSGLIFRASSDDRAKAFLEVFGKLED